MTKSLLFVALAVVAGCAARGTTSAARPAGTTPPRASLVSFERDQFYAECPSYKLDIDTDGNVRYEGLRGVYKDEGNDRLPPAKLAELRAAIARARFASLPEHCCDDPCSDTPTLTLTVADPAPARTLVDSYCSSSPSTIRNLAADIDAIVDITRWIGTEAERPRCRF